MVHFESSRQSRLHVSRALKAEARAVADENDLETRSCRTWNVRDLHIWQLARVLATISGGRTSYDAPTPPVDIEGLQLACLMKVIGRQINSTPFLARCVGQGSRAFCWLVRQHLHRDGLSRVIERRVRSHLLLGF